MEVFLNLERVQTPRTEGRFFYVVQPINEFVSTLISGKIEYWVCRVTSRRQFSVTGSYSLCAFIDFCWRCEFFLSCSVSALWCCTDQSKKQQIILCSSFESSRTRKVHRKLLILIFHLFMSVLLYFSFPLWRRVLRTPPLPSLRQSAPSV